MVIRIFAVSLPFDVSFTNTEGCNLCRHCDSWYLHLSITESKTNLFNMIYISSSV